MDQQLQRACAAVASEIGADVGEFTPANEKHFFGEAAMLGMAGSFLAGFFGGFAKEAGEKSGEKVGELLVDYISKRIEALRGKPVEEQTHALEADVADAKAVTLSPEAVAAISAAVEKALAHALSQQAETDIADRVAARVRQQAVLILKQAA